MAVQIQLRHGVAADWTAVNPLLAEGEVGVETDTHKFKFGNGVDNWNTLPYAVDIVSVVAGGSAGLMPLDGKAGKDSLIPGPAGAAGAMGPAGPPGPMMLSLDGKRGRDSITPGPAGPQGPAGVAGGVGIQGIAGPPGPPGLDGRPREPLMIPGPRGATGATGGQGMPGLDGRPPREPLMIQGPQGPAGPQGAPGAPGAGGGGGSAMLMPLDGKPGRESVPLVQPTPQGVKISALPAAANFDAADILSGVETGVTVQFSGQQVLDAILKFATGVTVAAGVRETLLALAAASANITGVGLVTVMTITAVGAGTYYFYVFLVYQTTAVTTGIDVAVNHTGTTTQWVNEIIYAATGQLAATAAATELANNAAGNIMEQAGGRTKNTAIGGGTVSVDTANTDHIMRIEGFFTVTVSGNVEVKLAAEAAALVTTARIGSYIRLTKLS